LGLFQRFGLVILQDIAREGSFTQMTAFQAVERVAKLVRTDRKSE
jgi:hypothetical protein